MDTAIVENTKLNNGFTKQKLLNQNIRKKINKNLKLKVEKQENNEDQDILANNHVENNSLTGGRISDNLIYFYQKEPKYDDYYLNDSYFNVCMKKGNLSVMEDRYVAFTFNDDIAFFGVFDGHRSTLVPEYLVNKLFDEIKQNQHYQTDIKKAIKEAFSLVDNQLQEILVKELKQGGSTALCALFKKDTVYIINLGDSSALMISDNKSIKLNTEHSAKIEEEKKRIEQMGGFILKDRVSGGLMVTRAFGDTQYKPYVICDPDITEYKLSSLDEFLLIGTDGFWNALSPQNTLDYISEWKKTRLTNGVNSLSYLLLNEAFQQKLNIRKDNMTLMIIDVGHIYRCYNRVKQYQSIFKNKLFSKSCQKKQNFENFRCNSTNDLPKISIDTNSQNNINESDQDRSNLLFFGKIQN